MCFDVPWKTDRLRLTCYYRELLENDVSNLTFRVDDVMTSYHLFLNEFGCDRASQTQFGAMQCKFRPCLQAALCHTRAPDLLYEAMCRSDAQPNSDRSMRVVICDLSQRYNDMQIALLNQVVTMTKNQKAAFALEMRQVVFFLSVCVLFKSHK